MDEDRERWDRRYTGVADAVPRPPDAAAAADLVEALPHAGRALDVAAGLGPVSIWLARRGLSVTAIDVSPVAIDAIRRGDDTGAVTAHCVDLDDGLPDGLGTFDVIVCQRFRAPHVIAALPGLLRPGGFLIVTVLSQVGAASPGPFHAPAGELDRLLGDACAGWTRHHHTEADGEASIVLSRPSQEAST